MVKKEINKRFGSFLEKLWSVQNGISVLYFFYMLCIFINFQCLNRPISVSFLIRTSGKVKITVKLAGLCLNNFENKENSGKRAELCCILSSQSLVNFEKGKQLKRSKKFLHKVVKCEKLDLSGRGFCILYKSLPFRRPCKIILQQYSNFK